MTHKIRNLISLNILCFQYVFLMSEAIVALAGENIPTRSLNRRSSAHVHWFLQVVGVVCIFAGTVVKYQHREEKYGSHFTSTHSVVGIISVAGLVVVCFSGLPALFAVRLRKRIRPVCSKFGHNLLGSVCFLLGMVAQCLGYQKNSIKRQAEGMVVWMTLGTALITVLSLVGAVRQLKAHSLSVRKNILGWWYVTSCWTLKRLFEIVVSCVVDILSSKIKWVKELVLMIKHCKLMITIYSLFRTLFTAQWFIYI